MRMCARVTNGWDAANIYLRWRYHWERGEKTPDTDGQNYRQEQLMKAEKDCNDCWRRIIVKRWLFLSANELEWGEWAWWWYTCQLSTRQQTQSTEHNFWSSENWNCSGASDGRCYCGTAKTAKAFFWAASYITFLLILKARHRFEYRELVLEYGVCWLQLKLVHGAKVLVCVCVPAKRREEIKTTKPSMWLKKVNVHQRELAADAVRVLFCLWRCSCTSVRGGGVLFYRQINTQVWVGKNVMYSQWHTSLYFNITDENSNKWCYCFGRQ